MLAKTIDGRPRRWGRPPGWVNGLCRTKGAVVFKSTGSCRQEEQDLVRHQQMPNQTNYSAEQLQSALRHTVSLRQHRSAGLLQDL